jgi:hypothetical protein
MSVTTRPGSSGVPRWSWLFIVSFIGISGDCLGLINVKD